MDDMDLKDRLDYKKNVIDRNKYFIKIAKTLKSELQDIDCEDCPFFTGSTDECIAACLIGYCKDWEL